MNSETDIANPDEAGDGVPRVEQEISDI